MKAFFLRGMMSLVIGASLIASLSCARDQQLVSIDVIPATETFGASDIPVSADAGLSVQLRALGHYIHPPVVKDITNEVTWGSNTPQMVTVNSTGLITATGNACGVPGTIISATVNTNTSSGGRSSSGAIVTGSMTANVVCFSGSGGGTNPILSVTVAGSGSVTSSPTGINCPGTSCSANFGSGTQITLTAVPSGTATGVNWAGCNPSGLTCTLTLTANSAVSATFF